MKTLTIRLPYISQLMFGPKDIELRNFNPKHRGRVLLHVSKTVEKASSLPVAGPLDWGNLRGHIVGVANLDHVFDYRGGDGDILFKAHHQRHLSRVSGGFRFKFGWVFCKFCLLITYFTPFKIIMGLWDFDAGNEWPILFGQALILCKPITKVVI